jgi:hypothetical protein
VSTLLYQDGEYPPGSDDERAGSAAVTSPPGRSGAQRKRVPVMTEVACFCGCLFSFDSGAGACPKCGEIASVTGLPVLEAPDAPGRKLRPLSCTRSGKRRGEPGTGRSGTLPGIAITTIALRPPDRPEAAEAAMIAFATGASLGLGEAFAGWLAADG